MHASEADRPASGTPPAVLSSFRPSRTPPCLPTTTSRVPLSFARSSVRLRRPFRARTGVQSGGLPASSSGEARPPRALSPQEQLVPPADHLALPPPPSPTILKPIDAHALSGPPHRTRRASGSRVAPRAARERRAAQDRQGRRQRSPPPSSPRHIPFLLLVLTQPLTTVYLPYPLRIHVRGHLGVWGR